MKNKIDRYALTTQHRDDLYTESPGCCILVTQQFKPFFKTDEVKS